MAIPLSGITLPFVPTRVPSQSKIALPLTFSTRKHPSLLQGRVKLRATSQQITSIELSNGNKGSNNSNEGDAPERALAERWREIHGRYNWAGMLEPLDPMLRSELIRYGEMAQACYDAYDYDDYSNNCGKCRFPESSFFKDVGMEGCGYDITRNLFATSRISMPKWFSEKWSEKANWIGYVAVSNDETSQRLGRRDITIAWRGTSTKIEWVHDFIDILLPLTNKIPCKDPFVKAELGFSTLYTGKDESSPNCKLSLREQILAEVSELMKKYDGEELSITVTGHSLGAALAVLSAFDIAEKIRQDGSSVPICVFPFSGPRVGNIPFKERLENALGVRVLRVHNVHDVVPKVPGKVLNECFPLATNPLVKPSPWSYSHVGMELQLDHTKSPYLKHNVGASSAHNLEALMHLIDGYHTKGGNYIRRQRSIGLVNKDCDFLKDHLMTPPNWIRQNRNKGMVRSEDSHCTNRTSKSNEGGTP